MQERTTMIVFGLLMFAAGYGLGVERATLYAGDHWREGSIITTLAAAGIIILGATGFFSKPQAGRVVYWTVQAVLVGVGVWLILDSLRLWAH